MTTTFRSATRAGLVTILQAFQSANPTMLRSVFTSRPEGFTGDYPIAFVDTFPESVLHTSGVRGRTGVVTVVVVDAGGTNAEQVAAWDALVDGLMDHFTSYPHISTGTIWDRMSVAEYDETIGEQLRPAVRFTFENIYTGEGRT
jgi:hypothetical protein